MSDQQEKPSKGRQDYALIKEQIKSQIKNLQDKLKKAEQKEIETISNFIKKFDLISYPKAVLEKAFKEVADKLKREHPNEKK